MSLNQATELHWFSFPSPLGWITVRAEGEAISALKWGREPADQGTVTPLLDEAQAQLLAYFDRRLESFDLPMSCASTGFQHLVWESMLSIPYGHTKTYGDIANYVEGPAQAVGNACGANPIPILIPCHRVLGATSLGGFSGAGGVESKVFLLRLEGAAGILI